LPQQAETSIRSLSGEVSRNITEFSHCREFRGTATVRFSADPASDEPLPQERATLEKVTLPEGLRLTLGLETPVSSNSAAVGDPLSAKTSSAVNHNGKTILPAGATLKGRIRWLERQATGYVVGLEFSTVLWEDKQARFLARLDSVQDPAGRLKKFQEHSVTANQLATRRLGNDRIQRTQHVESFQFRDLPGVALLMISGNSFKLSPGLRLSWTTVKQ
jgi:hypothetical protein